MKQSSHSFLFITAIAFICGACQHSIDKLPCIDVRKIYPDKEILLPEIADISYFVPCSDDGFLYNGTIRSITQKRIVIADFDSGTILFFAHDGTAISHFNHQGNGPKEYRRTRHIFYDEKEDDLFLIDDSKQVIQVYSSLGEHKRELTLPQGTRINNDIISLDDCSLMFYDTGIEYRRAMVGDLSIAVDTAPFYLISKKDGAVIDHFELRIPSVFLGIYLNGLPLPGNKRYLTKCNEGALLCIPENDTVFLYNKEQSLIPVVRKAPLAISTYPVSYLNNCIDMGSHLFSEVYEVHKGEEFALDFPVKYYMMNKNTGDVVHPKLLLPDYQGKIFIISPNSRNRNFENIYYFELDLLELKEAYTQDRLSGKLKELVVTLKEDDNNVFVLAHFK